jgi:hypothetical protein
VDGRHKAGHDDQEMGPMKQTTGLLPAVVG